MTQEECIGLLKRYAEYDGMGIPNLAGCKEAMRMAAELLEGTSLPSNIDEAAEEYGRKEYSHAIHFWDEGLSKNKPEVMKEDFVTSFKAGAEWMAEQFQKIEGELVDWYETKGVDYCCGIKTEDAFKVPEGFYIKKK